MDSRSPGFTRLGSLILLAHAAHAVPLAAQQAHPADPEGFAAAMGVKHVNLLEVEGLQLWCEDEKQLQLLEEPLREAWELADALLAGLPMPEDVVTRVVVLQDADALRRYPQFLEAECAKRKVGAPPPSFVEGVIQSGSAHWGNPPVLMISGQVLRKQDLVTRAVHDLAAVRVRFAASPYAAEPPEFLKEGVAGMVVRRCVKRPSALVSHQDAAVSERIKGYGVFAGIEHATTDGSNHPHNWPSIMRGAVKAMRKLEEIPQEARIDGFLVRGAEGFARADYAYAWAITEFLFDERMPFGKDALAEMAERRWKPAEEALDTNRRTVLLPAVRELRDPDLTLASGPQRGARLLALLVEGYGETPEELHEGFMLWVEKAMPKK